MEKLSKEPIILIVFIFIVISIIVLISLMLIIISNKNNISSNNENDNIFYEDGDSGISPTEEEVAEETKDDVYIDNMSEITEIYYSDLPIAKVSVRIEDVIMNIFNLAIEADNMQNFYNINKVKIQDTTSASNYNEFVQLMSKIYKRNKSKIKTAKIKENSAKRNSNIIVAQIEFELRNGIKSIINVQINEDTSKIKML